MLISNGISSASFGIQFFANWFEKNLHLTEASELQNFKQKLEKLILWITPTLCENDVKKIYLDLMMVFLYTHEFKFLQEKKLSSNDNNI